MKKHRFYSKESPFEFIEDCIKYLEDNDELLPGNIIEMYVFEYIIGKEFSEDMDWMGPYLVIKDAIEREGFFTTTRGTDGKSLRVLRESEVWKHSQKRNKNRSRTNDKDLSIVKRTPTSILSESDRKKHMKELNKLSQIQIRLAEIAEGLG